MQRDENRRLGLMKSLHLKGPNFRNVSGQPPEVLFKHSVFELYTSSWKSSFYICIPPACSTFAIVGKIKIDQTNLTNTAGSKIDLFKV